jgi:hypothetical protein
MNRTPPNVTDTASNDADRQVVIDCFVAGFRYHEGLDIMSYLQPGDEVQLIAEPGNPYDEWAVRIEHRKSRIGYLPRGQNQVVSRLLQRGAPGEIKCRITAVDPETVPWEAVKVQVTTVA